LRGIHFIEDVTETCREDDRRWAVEHDKNAKSDDGRYFP